MHILHKWTKCSISWLYFLFGLVLPTQLGKHWWPEFSFINGLRVDYYSPTLYVSYLMLFLLIAATIPRYGRLWTITLLALSLGLVSFSPLALYRFGQYAAIVSAIFVVGYANHEERKKWLTGLFIASGLELILALWQLIQQESIQGLWWFVGERRYWASTPGIAKISLFGQLFVRPYATFSHPNSMGGFFMLTALLLWREKKPLWSLPGIVLVLLSFSRIALLGLALGLFITLIQKRLQCKLCYYVRILFPFWMAAFALLPVGSVGSWTERVTMWSNGMERFLSGWWHMPELGQYLYTGTVLAPTLFMQPIHNTLLIILMEWRWLGAAALLFLLVSVYKKMPLAIALPLLLIAFFDHYSISLVQNMLLMGGVIGWYRWNRTSEKMNRGV
ncbi:MAG: hypothetical protein NUV52_03985 [Candidatus Roizmanbacteria bacterium]|nr:hypothetical protein [Candidatus Roizmanbacteria bacterium]